MPLMLASFHSIGLIIWRPLVSSLRSESLPSVNKSQAQAGPRFYYSDLRAIVGRCFSFFTKRIRQKKRGQLGLLQPSCRNLFVILQPKKKKELNVPDYIELKVLQNYGRNETFSRTSS